jgi:hypothetical protein
MQPKLTHKWLRSPKLALFLYCTERVGVLEILPDAYFKGTPESPENQPFDQQCYVHRSYEAGRYYVQYRIETLNSWPSGGDTACFKARWLAYMLSIS